MCTCSDSPGDVAVVVDYYYTYGGYIALFITTCPRVIILAALQATGVFLSVLTITLHFGRCRQHSRQRPTAVLAVSNRWPRVGYNCGNRGNSDAVVEWIPAATLTQFVLSVFSSRDQQGESTSFFPTRFLLLPVFRIFLGFSTFSDHGPDFGDELQ